MYRIYGTKDTRAFRIIWAMEEIGLDYELVPVRPGSAEARALNPSGKVPFIEAEGEIIPDSAAILTYLADKHGALTHPAGSLARARQDGLSHLILDEFDAALWTAARHSFVLPEERRLPAIKVPLRWEFARNAKRLAARIGDGWLMGKKFTIADILLTHCLDWAAAAKFECDAPELAQYHARATARPAYKAARA